MYNFDLLKDWYILMWDRQVLGGTSPASVVMAAPALGTIDAIKVEQGVSLFGEVRHLWERDEDFVFYMYLLMNAYTTLRLHCGEVYGVAVSVVVVSSLYTSFALISVRCCLNADADEYDISLI